MDFWKAVLALARRKLVILPLLGLAIVAALAGYSLTPLHYVSSATMVLAPPAFGRTLSLNPAEQAYMTNPMLSLGNDLKTASTILIFAMNAPDAAAELGAAEGGPTQLTIDDGRSNPKLLDGNGPFVYVVGESTSRAEARNVVVRAEHQMRKELLDRQKSLGAPPETYLTMVDVVAPTTPKVTRLDKVKVGGAAFALSLILGLSAAYVWQLSRLRRAAPVRSKYNDKELESSRELGLHNDLGIVAEEWSGARRAARADTAWADGERDERDGESPVTGRPQPPAEELVNDDEQGVAANEDEAAQSAKPQQVSAIVGANGRAWIVTNERSLTTSMGGLKQEPVPEVTAAGDRDRKEAGFGAEYRAGETPEGTGPAPNSDLPDGEHVVADERLAADDERAREGAQPAESERIAYISQEATDVKNWDLYIVEHPPDEEGSALRSEDDGVDSSWDWDLYGAESERDSVAVGANRGTDVVWGSIKGRLEQEPVPYVADIDTGAAYPGFSATFRPVTRHDDGPPQLDFTISRQRWIAACLTSVGVCDFEKIIIAIGSALICLATSIAAARFSGMRSW